MTRGKDEDEDNFDFGNIDFSKIKPEINNG